MLAYKKVIKNSIAEVSESEALILIALDTMTKKGIHRTGNSLFKFMSKYKRTPHRKKMFATLRKLKQQNSIRVIGSKRANNIYLTFDGEARLQDLERDLKNVKG